MIDSDPWHYIGTGSEPAFQNSWSDYGSPWGSPRFRKGPDGIVHMDGLVKGGTAGSVMFTLPVGYRPSNPNGSGLHVPAVDSNWSNAGASIPGSALLYIRSDGTVYFGAGGSSGSWGSLCCSFAAT